MSRSFKKHPWVTDGKSGTTAKSKRYANKVIRNYRNKISNGKYYKRLFCSYMIHDYISRWSWEEAKKEYESKEYLQEYYPTLKAFYKYWSKYYRRK